jgi:signal transduction histidine kinase/DNA-binding response OmpR family regulator
VRVAPAAEQLAATLTELERRFQQGEANSEDRLNDSRDRATTALVILAVLILASLILLLTDVSRRILTPCAAAASALEDLAEGRTPPRLFEQSSDEIGALGRHFNRVAEIYTERGRSLAERDTEASVNAVLTVAATINDLSGFGSKVLEKILEVSGASSAVLYLPRPDGRFEPAVSIGGSPEGGIGAEEAARAAREGRPRYLAVDARTPTVNVFDGRILPRESAHIPLVYFEHVVGVLALGSSVPLTPGAKNALAAIAPSLAVALANAEANERVSEQSRRLAEQNELLAEQRSRIANTAAELQRASALKDRFLASVSHELRTPMTVILGFTATLLRGSQGALNAAQRESLERVQRNAKLLLALINDILDISKIEAGKAEVRVETVSLRELFAQVEKDYGEQARRKGLRLTTAVSPGLETITTDPAKLTQILANLLGNALKFTEAGEISVRAFPRANDRWGLTVEDTGIGIPEEEQEAIFEEFRQGEAPPHRGRGGTGLGLAIVRKLALLLGGTVSVDSSPGRGSGFTLVFPRELSGGIAAADERPPVSVPERAEGKTILVLDDDESIRKLLRFELEPHGVEVLEAPDGRTGIELAVARRPDAILLDVLMPRMDGWETLRKLKETPETRAIPVVILSVVENRTFGFSLGAFDYLVKPLSRPDLLRILARLGVLASRGRVLVVDDDPDVRTLLEQELASAGYRARSVAGGAEALEAMERERPAAVLLDLMMPPPDGFEVLYRIRQNPALRDVPVVVVTAKELTPADNERLNGSAQRIIRKGSGTGRLVREILETIEPGRSAERV